MSNYRNMSLKDLQDEYGYKLQKLERLHARGELNNDEKIEFEQLVQDLQVINGHIDAHPTNEKLAKISDRAQKKNGSMARKPTYGSGQVLDDEGKIRLYEPNQSIARDHLADADSDVGLGDYLRAVVQGPKTPKERIVRENSVTSSGYELPVNISAELVDRLRAANPIISGAGGRTITIEGGETKFIKITSDMPTAWHAELVEESPGDPSFDSISMSPSSLLAMTLVSNELLQDSQNVEEALTTSFIGAINDAILTATFAGATPNGPTGLASTVSQIEEFPNGGAPDFSNFVNAHGTLYSNNLPEEGRSHLLSPSVWTTLNNLTATDDQPIRKPFGILDVPEFTTSGVPTGEAYVGDFSNVVYGFRFNITLQQFPAAAAKKYGTLWVAGVRLDIATFRPAALVRIQEATA